MFFKEKNILVFCILLSLLNLQFQCNKRFGCEKNVYGFAIGIKAYPDKDNLMVGDTIWFEINEPTTLRDTQTGRMIDYSNAANLGSAIGFQALSPASGQFTIAAAQKFKLVAVQGTETANSNPDLYHEFLFAEISNTYLFQLGVIPKETGTFSVVFSNAANVYRKNDNCPKASFGLNFENTNQHYYLNPNFQGGPTPVGGNYYFKVN